MSVDGFMAITKALADESRVRTLMALGSGELCVCQIIDFLELAPSTVSRHMSVLRQAGLVKGRKQGRWMYYRLPGKEGSQAVRSALFWLRRSLSDHPVILRDNERIAEIIREHTEDQCQTTKN
jgi:ArsR family transcriptional regulator, arsenate/arsenite/antimonite-responsive transcriptional repressor